MERIERFDSLGAVHQARAALLAKREGHATAIRSHWDTMAEAEFRSGVVNGTLRGIWKAWSPMNTLGSVVGQPGDLTGLLLNTVLGGKGQGPWGRALIWVASATMPMLIDRLKQNDRARHTLSEFERSWQRIKNHMRERREARRANDQ